MPKIAYSYVRFSTPQQKKGRSGTRQVEGFEAWCKQFGYTPSKDTFRDEGRSAFKGKHLEGEGDLKRFLSLVESGKIRPGSVLIVENFDRFSRLPTVRAVKLFLDVITSGIGMAFLMTHDKRPITEDILNREDHLLYVIVGEAKRAYAESKYKSERVADACKHRREDAKKYNRARFVWTPPWCDFDDEKGYVPNKAKVAVVKRVFAEYLKGNGPFRIAKIFNDEKISPFGKWRKTYAVEWYKKGVRDILMDRRVYGYAHHLDKEGYYPVVIDRETFNRVQDRLALRKAAKPTGGRIARVGNLFTSICRCGECNSIMDKTFTRKTYVSRVDGAKKVTVYESLVCGGAKGGKKCSYKSVPYEFIEDTFFQVLDMDSKFYGAMTKSDNAAENRLASLRGEKVMVEKQIEKYRKMFQKMEEPPVSLMADLKEFEGKCLQLTKGIRLAEAMVQDGSFNSEEITDIQNNLSKKSEDPEFRLKLKEYINKIISHIVIEPDVQPENGGKKFCHYQVHFKNGFVCSVNLVKNGKEDKEGVSYQVLPGVAKKYDAKRIVYYTGDSKDYVPADGSKVKRLPTQFVVDGVPIGNGRKGPED